MIRARFPAALSFVLLVSAAPALAQRPQQVAQRAVVLPFSGPQGARSRAAVVANLQDHGWTIVSDDEVRTAQQSSGLSRLRGSQDYATVAAATHASAVVGGNAAHNRRTWSVTVTVYNGRDGARLGAATWSGGTMASLTGPRGSASDRLGRYLTQAQPAQPPPPEVHENAWDVAPHDEAETASEADEEDEQPTEDDARWDGFSIAVLGGTLHRDMDAEVFPAHLARTMGSEIRTYESAGAGNFELGVGGELYPGALIHGQPFPYLGLVVSYRHSVGLSSTGCAPGAADCTVNLPTDEQELYVGARFRYVVGGAARTGLELDFDAGYDLFAYTIDVKALQMLDPSGVVPPVSYSNFHLGAGLSYPVVPTYLRIGLRGALRLGLSIGDDARRIWGTNTGAGDAMAWTLFFRSEAPYIVKGFYFGVDIDWFAYYTKYSGTTACISMSGCPTPTDPWEQVHIPHGVTDSYVRVAISVGYAFR